MIKGKAYVIIALSLAVVAVTSALFLTGVLDRGEWISYDQRMYWYNKDKSPPSELAVVLIDEASLQAMDPLVGRWPWPRSVYADLLDFFSLGGARAVAFDILFVEREAQAGGNSGAEYGENDRRFMVATRDAGNVYHAMQLLREETHGENSGQFNRPIPESFAGLHALHNTEFFPESGNNDYLLPIEGLYAAAKGTGIVEIEPDRDGIYRRLKPFAEYQGKVYPSLGILPLLSAFEPDKISFQGDHIALAGRKLPIDPTGDYLINMQGDYKPYSVSGILSSIQKIRAGEIEDLLVYPEDFENKIVFIGASAIGIQDVKATPMSSKTPGVFLHVSMASNILENDFLVPIGKGATILLMVVFAVIVTGGILSVPYAHQQALIPLVLAASYIGWSFWRFDNGYVYNTSAPLMTIAGSWLVTSAYLAFTEGKDKRRVRTMLSQYVSPAVLAEMVDKHEELGKAEIGSKENLSILFSDIRSFTSISEQTVAEQVVELLNIYFSVMSDVVFRYDGTLDKFIGDALMAFWGAPIHISDHADKAVRAALEMQRAMLTVNEQLTIKGLPAIMIGVGINTGEVILGNIGSEKKLDYTVIGDNVNLASRLEGLTKQYGCPVVISEYTFNNLVDPIPCMIIDMVRVKGKKVPIRLYCPLALPDDDEDFIAEADKMSNTAARAFDCYLNREWDAAIALYEKLPYPILRDTFVARCVEFKSNEPVPDWDGVYTLTSK